MVNFSLILVVSDILKAGVKPEKHRDYTLYDSPSIATNVWRYVHVAAASRWHAVPRTERSEGRGVFVLVVRCRIMRLLLISRVGKNRDTRRETLTEESGWPVPPLPVCPLSREVVAAQKAIAYTDLLQGV